LAQPDRLRRTLVGTALPAAVTGIAAAVDAVSWQAAVAILAALAVSFLVLARSTRRSLPAPPPAAGAIAAHTPTDLLEHLPDPVILLNARREVVVSNRPAREALGVGLVGRDLAMSLRHPDILAAADAVIADGASLTEEIVLAAPIMRTFTLTATGLPVVADKEAPRVLFVLRDETKVKRAEQSRADFVANATHELRSPLSAIIGFIETLRGPARDDEDARSRFLQLMHGEAQRMARLVDDLMSLSRVEINEHVPPRVAVDVGEIVKGVASLLGVRAEAKAMTLEVDCDPGLASVPGDPDQLTQVFHNLVENAIKYGRQQTPIRIVVRLVDRLPGSSKAGISVAVIDQGEGILAEHVPRLTERFYRVDQGRSRRLGGTGLGLAIVKHIVRRHRGRLTIESEVGGGSVFTVFLPLVRDQARERREGSSPAADVTKV
jgi:two-component system, OmpR family, phosphate regulon sensor histidine kinase PhoR